MVIFPFQIKLTFYSEGHPIVYFIHVEVFERLNFVQYDRLANIRVSAIHQVN